MTDNTTPHEIAVITPSKLRAIRALLGISQAELARRAGISVVSVATFEAGTSDMKTSTIAKIFVATGVRVTYRLPDGAELSGP